MQRFSTVLGAITLAAMLGACNQTPPAENPNDTALGTQDITVPQGAPLIDFVEASKPEWNLDRAVGNNTCFPEPAFYPDGTPNEGQVPSSWPDADYGCLENLEEFPTYYSVQECRAESEIRVSYTIYQPSSYFFEGGHIHDFEGIYVIWKLDGDRWRRDELVMGRHGNWKSRWWRDVESWNPSYTEAGLGFEHPRIFVGWASHAMFNNQGGLTDIISQLYDNEHRSAKYPVNSSPLVEVTVDNDLGRRFDESKDHFGAGLQGNPFFIARDLCGLPSGDFSG